MNQIRKLRNSISYADIETYRESASTYCFWFWEGFLNESERKARRKVKDISLAIKKREEKIKELQAVAPLSN